MRSGMDGATRRRDDDDVETMYVCVCFCIEYEYIGVAPTQIGLPKTKCNLPIYAVLCYFVCLF